MDDLEMYDGFLIPKKDVLDLRSNKFIYNPEEERFEGALQDDDSGAYYNWFYYICDDIKNNFWEIDIRDEDYGTREEN